MVVTETSPIIVWLRHDLRMDDNPALAYAAETGRPVIPVFLLADAHGPVRPYGGAHRWWLHHSLTAFAQALDKAGSRLVLRRGDPLAELAALAADTKAGALYLNRRYGPEARAVDERLGQALPDLEIEIFDANLLHDPDRVKTGSGGYYKVYTPFMRSVLGARDRFREPIDPPAAIAAPGRFPKGDRLGDWGLLPTKPDWAKGFAPEWTPGEAAAHERLDEFCDTHLAGYGDGRNVPGEDLTSRMSPHLHFGEISAMRIFTEVEAVARRRKSVPDADRQTYARELVWRDFNHHLLYHFQKLGSENFNQRFNGMKWRDAPADLRKWQRGQTGYPIVDAGMRQLWQTGWMHNRVRMIVGSFLTKDLLIDWREGEAWFWDTLVDGDEANNTSQWQWIAGSGADAQPFFRIFNPIKQSRTFDAEGAYIRRFVPELAKLPDKAIHAPWEATTAELEKAGITLGKTYPHPIVAHDEARPRALTAYQATR